MHVPPTVQSLCWFVPKSAAVNDMEFNCAVRRISGHIEPSYTKLWCHNDIALSLTLLSTNLIAPSMALPWPTSTQATVRTSNDYSAAVCEVSAQGAGDTILYCYLLWLRKLLLSAWLNVYWTRATHGSHFIGAIKKMQQLAKWICHAGNIYL